MSKNRSFEVFGNFWKFLVKRIRRFGSCIFKRFFLWLLLDFGFRFEFWVFLGFEKGIRGNWCWVFFEVRGWRVIVGKRGFFLFYFLVRGFGFFLGEFGGKLFFCVFYDFYFLFFSFFDLYFVFYYIFLFFGDFG